MCGICGFCDFTRDNAGPVWREVGERMGETLAHRGPDGKGLWQGADCVLVHRRLAVIDPERGQQPMARVRDGVEYVLIYNGELYNTDELRRELRKLGFSFETESDTEVLLNACIAWGWGGPTAGGHLRLCFLGREAEAADVLQGPVRRQAILLCLEGRGTGVCI